MRDATGGEQVLDQFRIGLSEREEKQLRGLLRRKNRQQERLFLAEGVRVVEDLLASAIVTEWAVAATSLEDSERGTRLLGDLQRQLIPRRIIPDEQLLKLAPTE